MNRGRAGFTLIELLVVVAIIAILVGIGSNYYGDMVSEARVNTATLNLKIVRDAISRYFKDNMRYPTDLKELHGPYLEAPVESLLIDTLGGNASLRLEYNTSAADVSFYDRTYAWGDSGDLALVGKQIRNVKIKYNGTEMPW
jgi:general secretion pathway protein G